MGLLAILRTKPGFDEKRVREIVDKADVNGDGSLSVKELRKAFEELGSGWPGLRAWHSMRNSDGNGDGKISSSEKDKLVSYIMNWYDANHH